MCEFQPYVEELCPAPDVEQAFRALSRRPHCLFLDSALRHPELGRYSFLSAEPSGFLSVPADGTDGLARLAAELSRFTSQAVDGVPPFQGGAAGLFAYELNRSLERIPPARFDEFGLPALAVGFYDVVLAFDHRDERAWIISQGFPQREPVRRRRRARERAAEFRRWLELPVGEPRRRPSPACPPVPAPSAPRFPMPGPAGLVSDFSAAGYQRAVQRVVDSIAAGDVFQVNLSQRLMFPAGDDSVELYLRLRRRNASPFAAYFDLGDYQIASASPERFLNVRAGVVQTRPIKGTRQRTWGPEADLYAGEELKQSEKDRAENVMIVDLLRNDLARVCQPDSVQVTQLCGLERYPYVQHLVSVVQGQLSAGAQPVDLLRAAFPGGSITGAPKVRAMEIIAQIEPTARGAYCGSLGYLGFDETMDLSILIRTITAGGGWWQLPVGGGIVYQSDPWREYQETWHKANGMIRALE